MAMQGKAAKLALWKSMFANWVASRFPQLLVDLARMVAKSCAWPLDALCCLQRVLSSPWEARALVLAFRSESISCGLSWSRGPWGAGVPVVQIRRILPFIILYQLLKYLGFYHFCKLVLLSSVCFACHFSEFSLVQTVRPNLGLSRLVQVGNPCLVSNPCTWENYFQCPVRERHILMLYRDLNLYLYCEC